MFIKVTRQSVVDRDNPERKFKRNQVLKINDPQRAKEMLSNGYGIEVEETKDFEELDKKETEKKTQKVEKPSKK